MSSVTLHPTPFLIGSFLLLSLGNWYAFGMYDPLALTAVTIGFVFLLAAAWRDTRTRHLTTVPEKLLHISLLVCLLLNAIRPPGIYMVWPLYSIVFQSWSGLLAI